MRLLDTHTGLFIEVPNPSTVRYAILSHTWDGQGEQTYQVIKELQVPYSSKPSPPVVPQQSSSTESQRQSSRTHRKSSPSQTAPKSSPPSFWDDRRLSRKVRSACAVARADGYRYIWIDSCCIDKTSSSELSEAINSMYLWYRSASVCYAFLADVPAGDLSKKASNFRGSRWFTRGWTLQELIAPRDLVFTAKDWSVLGSKSSLAELVAEVTGIDRAVLTRQKRLSQVSVAQRMSWASKRKTTRIEDEAYSLLGIFDITMTTLYGEGDRAFVRLQEEILKTIPDQTIFAWGRISFHALPFQTTVADDPSQSEADSNALTASKAKASRPDMRITISPHREDESVSRVEQIFASSPHQFSSRSGVIHPISHQEFIQRLSLAGLPLPEYAPSPYGMRAVFPMLSFHHQGKPLLHYQERPETLVVQRKWHFILLACEHARHRGELVARACFGQPFGAGAESLQSASCSFSNAAFNTNDLDISGPNAEHTLFMISPTQLQQCRAHLRATTVYLPSPTRSPSSRPRDFTWDSAGTDLPVQLSRWAVAVLRTQGYDVALRTLGDQERNAYRVGLVDVQSKETWNIRLLKSRGSYKSSAMRVFAAVDPLTLREPQDGEVFTSNWDFWDPEKPRFEFKDIKFRNAGRKEITVRMSLDQVTSSEPFDLRIEVIEHW